MEEEASHGRQKQPFTLEELNEAIKLTKRGKAPGTDNVRMELIKWLGKDSLHYARLATIYKKGEEDKANNYINCT